MKIITVVGARPQFIKAASGSRVFKNYFEEVLIHTGQHYDENMSDVFFKEMNIPVPKYNLEISQKKTHGEMTGNMIIQLEQVLILEKPDAVIVYGDTNSTLAAALAAVKLNIPVIHIEAGNRLGTLNNPEEVNRICTDHCSSLLFCATEDAYHKLEHEGLDYKAHVVGNIMYDSYLFFADKPLNNGSIVDFNGCIIELPSEYYYLTCHRQENTYSDAPLKEILYAMNSLDVKTIYPVHPRNQERALRICQLNRLTNVLLVKPVGYSTSVYLTKHAKKIVTDSGGLQCEAFYAGVQCVFVFDFVAWPETMVGNRNQLARADSSDIIKKLSLNQVIDPLYQPFGDGHAAEKIADTILKWSKKA